MKIFGLNIISDKSLEEKFNESKTSLERKDKLLQAAKAELQKIDTSTKSEKEKAELNDLIYRIKRELVEGFYVI